MNESTKTRAVWSDAERSLLKGAGIDIGCGGDPILPGVRPFDLDHGNAQFITQHVHETFDFVYSSHCLEHMTDPKAALHEWWKLVRPGGHLIVIVPDEDLYEQGVFPSRFNPDHKCTFTISKLKSWSPVSYNLLEIGLCLPGSHLVSIHLQDVGYDRRRLRHGPISECLADRILRRIGRLCRQMGMESGPPAWSNLLEVEDQTRQQGVMAQIQLILRKSINPHD